MHRTPYSGLLFLILALQIHWASAGEGAPPPPPPSSVATTEPFTRQLEVDLPLILAFGVLWAFPSVVDIALHPTTCAPACNPEEINALDRYAVGYDSRGARLGSNLLLAAMPVSLAALSLFTLRDHGMRGAFGNIFLIVETVVVASGVNQLVKVGVARPRPYMYRGDAHDTIRHNNGEDYRSFYSNHTTIIFSAASAFAYIFAKHYPKSGWRWATWTFAVAGGVSMAVLRVTGGKHFFTDVAAGAAMGIAFGILVPALHQQPRTPKKPAVTWGVSPGFTGVMGRF